MVTKKHVFTENEKKYFMYVLRKYSGVIENKESDGVALRRKNEAWVRVTAEFNASPFANTQASVKQLRRLWINIKQRQREARRKEPPNQLVDRSPSNTHSDTNMPLSVSRIDGAVVSDNAEEATQRLIPEKLETQNTNGLPEQKLIIEIDPHDSSQISQDSLSSDPSIIHPSRTQSLPSIQSHTDSVIEKEYHDRLVRASEKHDLEIQILRERLREAKAKAQLAELILRQKMDSTGRMDNL